MYSGSKLLREKTNSSEIWYLYNELGLIGFEYNLVTYHYLRNYEGDVVAVIDTSSVIVASYTYDAFGKIISKTGTMSDINPIRYRGYYYDDESS
ncbi:MAG: RHS repeat-associated core domain-containing protein, partial [Christensenellaceae bacterium]|nr:RHS repeat-associated core domain-containing protein [Christensenellaceae bacterium]